VKKAEEETMVLYLFDSACAKFEGQIWATTQFIIFHHVMTTRSQKPFQG